MEKQFNNQVQVRPAGARRAVGMEAEAPQVRSRQSERFTPRPGGPLKVNRSLSASNVAVRISNDRKTLIIEKNGVPVFINVGLIKYMLDMPYTRKDGTAVTLSDIRAMKERNRVKLDAVIEKGSRPIVTRPKIVSRA